MLKWCLWLGTAGGTTSPHSASCRLDVSLPARSPPHGDGSNGRGCPGMWWDHCSGGVPELWECGTEQNMVSGRGGWVGVGLAGVSGLFQP